MVSKNDINEYLKETIDSVKILNDLIATQVKNVKLGYSRLTKFIQSKDTPDYDRWQLIRSIKLNKFKGVLELEQLATVASAIIQYIKYIHDKRNLLLWGCVQSGKTLNYSFLMCILPIIHRLFTKEKIFPVLFVPNKINLCSGAKQELRNLLTLYKDVDVFVDGESASMDAPFTVWYDEIFESKKMDSVIDFLIRQRNPSSVNKFEKSLISLDEQFTEKEIKTLLFHDEKHNGSAVVSIQNDIQFFLNNCKSLHKIIGITATPAEPNSAGGKNYITVVSYVDSHKYMGFGTYNGMNIHDIRNEKIKQPEIKSIEEEFKPKNCYLDLKMFSQEKYFLENRSRYEVFSNQDQYRIEFSNWITEIYTKLASEESPIFFIRPFDNVSPCEILLELIEKRLKELNLNHKFKTLRYFGKNLDEIFKGKTVKEVLIDEFVNKKLFCLIMNASGRSNMGDSYPKECVHFMDLKPDFPNVDFFHQGTAGRASGNNKKSICYFRESYIISYIAFLKNHGYSTEHLAEKLSEISTKKCKKYNERTKTNESPNQFNQTIIFEDYKELSHLYNDFYWNLNKICKRIEPDSSSACIAAERHLYGIALGKKTIRLLEKLTKVCFPEWGSEKEEIKYGGESVHFGHRLVKSAEHWKQEKTARTLSNGSAKPQIIYTIKPDYAYEIFMQDCLVHSGENKKLSTKLVYQHELWKICEIVPIGLVLRFTSRKELNLEPTEKSLEYKPYCEYSQEEHDTQISKDQNYDKEIKTNFMKVINNVLARQNKQEISKK